MTFPQNTSRHKQRSYRDYSYQKYYYPRWQSKRCHFPRLLLDILPSPYGTWYPTATTAKHVNPGCYSGAELFDKFDVTPTAEVYVESYVDGYGRAEKYDAFIKKYIGWHATAEYITMGQYQSRKDDAIWNPGYYILSAESFAYIPEAGLNVAAVFERIGMADVTQYKFTYADGKVELKYAEEIPGLVIAADSNLLTIEAQ